MIFIRKMKKEKTYIAANQDKDTRYLNYCVGDKLYILDLNASPGSVLQFKNFDGTISVIKEIYKSRGEKINMFFKTRDKFIVKIMPELIREMNHDTSTV